MTDLEKKIVDAAQAYYTDGTSPYTDAEFDAMVDELRAINPNSDIFKVGWGYDVNLDTTPGEKVPHKYGRAGSLDKCRTWEQYVGSKVANITVDASLKLDGISVVLYYKDSLLVQALTRGDGEIGIDITDKIRKIFPYTYLQCPAVFTGAVRGEILMSYKDFEAFADEHPDAKNPRNSTAGLIGSKGTPSDLSYLSIVVYTIVGDEGSTDIGTTSDIRQKLRMMFDDDSVVPCKTVSLNANNFIEEMEACRDAWYNTYPADGIVLTELNQLEATPGIEYTAKAFKFPAEQGESEVLEVEWNMSKTHYAVPRIRIKPITLSGATVTYCTGYNAQYIKDNKIGPGAIIKLQRRGEVVPNIDEVVKSTEAQIPDTCPVCDTKLFWEGVHLKCNNLNCSNAVIQDTLVFMKQLAPVDGLSDLLIKKMLKSLIDLGTLKDMSIESIMECDVQLTTGISVQHNKFVEMWDKLHTGVFSGTDALLALNLPRFGEITCAKLAEHPSLLRAIILDATHGNEMRVDVFNTLVSVVGSASARSAQFSLQKFRRLTYLNILYDDIHVGNKVENRGKVAITGKLSVKRADFEAELKAHGFTVGDITKDTKCLITDDPYSDSSKNAKASKLGIPKVTEAEFRSTYFKD